MKTPAAATLSLIFALFACVAGAAEVPFDHAQFEATRAAGKPVAVVFHADWCPTCRAQAPLLRKLSLEPAFRPLTLYVADFDTEKALKQSLGITRQSTIVVFEEGKEVARSTGDTQEKALAALLRQAIS